MPLSAGLLKLPLRSLGLGVSLLLSPLGCQPELPTEEPEALATTAEQELRIANSLTTRALVYNAISTNPTANDLVAGNALTGLFDPAYGNAYLRLQLRDVDAQHFMEYLVGCALDGTQSIAWKNPLTGTTEYWKGKAGLCTKWATQVPSEACKRRVSACILARNNAFGRRVELSMRGEDPADATRFALEPKTPAVDYDPDLAQQVPSFRSCTTLSSGMHRDCGWKPDFIGRCQPGQTVRLGAGGRAPDACTSGAALGSTSSGRAMLRVCDGIVGCDEASTHQLAQSEGSCSTTLPAVTFTCPASGDFNVMTAPYDSWLSASAVVGVETGTLAYTAYGLSEKAVFGIREGAFYGTLFDSSALGANVYVRSRDYVIVGKDQSIPGSVYKRMFSCHAPEWTAGLAYATHRVCAEPDAEDGGVDCAATVTGACITPSDRSYPASMCGVEDGSMVSGDGDFEQCQDLAENLWSEPVTVYLHAPCDVLSTAKPDLCAWKSLGSKLPVRSP